MDFDRTSEQQQNSHIYCCATCLCQHPPVAIVSWSMFVLRLLIFGRMASVAAPAQHARRVHVLSRNAHALCEGCRVRARCARALPQRCTPVAHLWCDAQFGVPAGWAHNFCRECARSVGGGASVYAACSLVPEMRTLVALFWSDARIGGTRAWGARLLTECTRSGGGEGSRLRTRTFLPAVSRTFH